ncbi:hypothetical protein BV898_12225 [Hypsibius exemplaris]|uniref:Uncharacterized protein n=1 Tax=Hypsibius exemplaris TaxID=2072580 RepID=A0A1W0WEH7_HYPEX|nr:hypothetical protein BV898_12225 [Hypsibius exemplaris]
MRNAAPEIIFQPRNELSLFGAPLLTDSLPIVINAKTVISKLISSRLDILPARQSLFLLKNCLAVPKAKYLLRCAQTYECMNEQNCLDEVIRDSVKAILNTVMPLAVVLFIDIDTVILEPTRLRQTATGQTTPHAPKVQNWSSPVVKAGAQELMANVGVRDKAVLLALRRSESSKWLNAIPNDNVSTLLEGDSFRIAFALGLGANVCEPHICRCEVQAFHPYLGVR